MKDLPYDLWEPVIGLEIHAQLNTQTKLFSGALNQFGDEPNTNITASDTGHPGALPVLNRKAVHKAIQFGLAIGAEIVLITHFDRKSYFYPDSPRNFQITQHEKPLIRGGSIHAEHNGISRTFSIRQAHLEDDAGMLKHFSSYSAIDFNRAGAPLLEIVSEPCIHTAKEAVAYAMTIRTLLLYLDVSDGNMEEGSLRIDANISIRPKGEKELRPRIEIKNINSFTFLEMAINAEIARQITLYTTHPHRTPAQLIPPGTYRWDPELKQIVLMRSKESADDYRYFPEPDLVPLILTDEWIDTVRLTLPELPQNRYQRYINDLGLSPYSASLLIHDKPLSDYFEEALQTSPHPRLLCNWITIEFAGRLKGKTFQQIALPAVHIGELVSMIAEGRITGPIAKALADEMVLSPHLTPHHLVAQNPAYQPLTDTDSLEKTIDLILEANPQSINDYKAGKTKVFAYLVGQVMKETNGRAPPKLVNDLLLKKISC